MVQLTNIVTLKSKVSTFYKFDGYCMVKGILCTIYNLQKVPKYITTKIIKLTNHTQLCYWLDYTFLTL
jgi:hypothetical protein